MSTYLPQIIIKTKLSLPWHMPLESKKSRIVFNHNHETFYGSSHSLIMKNYLILDIFLFYFCWKFRKHFDRTIWADRGHKILMVESWDTVVRRLVINWQLIYQNKNLRIILEKYNWLDVLICVICSSLEYNFNSCENMLKNTATKNADSKEVARLKDMITKLKAGESIDEEEMWPKSQL